MKNIKLPATIYVTIETPAADEQYLQVNKTLQECAVIGEVRDVGKYQLCEVCEVGVAITKKPK